MTERITTRERGFRARLRFLQTLAKGPRTGQQLAATLEVELQAAHRYGRQLVEQGLVLRDNTTYPWIYGLTEEGREVA